MKWLTKSDYLKYLIHPAYLWLQKHAKDKLPPFDEAAQALVDQGNELELLARKRFSEGTAVKSKFSDAVRETEGYVKAGVKTIFHASVLTERRLFAAADVLIKNADGSWDIHEIKSTTKVKPDHEHDLAFQRLAFEESGYKIRKTFLVHINNRYVRRGELDPRNLFISVDVTEKVEHLLPETGRSIDKALAIVGLPECPDDAPALSHNYYGWRGVYRHLHPEIPASSILNMCRLTPQQVKQLAKLGVTELDQIPDGFELKPQQTAQLAALKKGEAIIHPIKIAHHLNKLRYPLYFFDYETVGGGVPRYEGTRPYVQAPFQYSLHILDEPEGELTHREFLAESFDNPMPALLTQLRRDIGATGSVIVWNKSFEIGVNQMMVRLYPEHKEFLRSINRRVYDLMEVFSNFYYSDAAFLGSASIKKVLPVVVPDLNYDSLAIQKGDVASRLWQQAARGKVPAETAQQIFKDLRTYCAQDTLAMVKIYEFLLKVKENAPGAQMSLLR